MEIGTPDKLIIQSIIGDFANFSPAYRECLHKESLQGMSGVERECNNDEVVENSPWARVRLVFFSSGPLYLARYLEYARCSVSVG